MSLVPIYGPQIYVHVAGTTDQVYCISALGQRCLRMPRHASDSVSMA